jgi:hypothetical protein
MSGPNNPSKENIMKNTKSLLFAAALSGALAALALPARAETSPASGGARMEKMGCNGKSAQAGDKASCQGMDKQGKAKDKHSCSGKEGCGGKNGKDKAKN